MLTKTPIKLSLRASRQAPEKIRLMSAGMTKPLDAFNTALMKDVGWLNDAVFDVGRERVNAERIQSAAIEKVADRVNVVQNELGDRGSSKVPTVWSGVGAAQDMAKLALDRVEEESRKVCAENEALQGLVASMGAELRASQAATARLTESSVSKLGHPRRTNDSRSWSAASRARYGWGRPRARCRRRGRTSCWPSWRG